MPIMVFLALFGQSVSTPAAPQPQYRTRPHDSIRWLDQNRRRRDGMAADSQDSCVYGRLRSDDIS